MTIASQRMRACQASAALAALLTLAACGDKAAQSPAPAPAPSAAAAPAATAPAPAPRPQQDEEAAASAKMQTYIACFNGVNSRGHDAMRRYAGWVDMKAGPTGKERAIHGVYTLSESDVKACGEPVAKAADGPPALPSLDAAAKAYSAAVQDLGASLAQADQYYSRQDYKDDAMAKGKAMHPQLAQHMQAFETAAKTFDRELSAENDKRQLARLAAVEKAEGRQFEYWHLASMIAARQLVGVVSEETFEVNAANDRLKGYEEAMQGLLDYTKTPDAKKPTMFSMMDKELEDFLVAAKNRIRRVRDKEPYRPGDLVQINANAGWMVRGTPDQVIREYNELIQASNRMR